MLQGRKLLETDTVLPVEHMVLSNGIIVLCCICSSVVVGVYNNQSSCALVHL